MILLNVYLSVGSSSGMQAEKNVRNFIFINVATLNTHNSDELSQLKVKWYHGIIADAVIGFAFLLFSVLN